ncbi:hypothetical protein D3C85_1533270 [compost metagenome]
MTREGHNVQILLVTALGQLHPERGDLVVDVPSEAVWQSGGGRWRGASEAERLGVNEVQIGRLIGGAV